MTTPLADEVAIRRAEQADLLDVLRIERASFPQPWPFSAFEQFLDSSAFLVAERNGEIVGYVVADTTPNYGRDIGHVKDFAVRADAREQGIGTRLLRQTLVALAITGTTDVKLEVRETNVDAISLYRSFGFRPARRVSQYYNNGDDALIMVVDVEQWLRNGESQDVDLEDIGEKNRRR